MVVANLRSLATKWPAPSSYSMSWCVKKVNRLGTQCEICSTPVTRTHATLCPPYLKPLKSTNSTVNVYGKESLFQHITRSLSIISGRGLSTTTSLLSSSDKPKYDAKRPFLSHQQVLKEKRRKNEKIVQIWNGITPLEFARQCQCSVDDVYEAMIVLDIDDLSDESNLREIANKLGYRYSFIQKPKLDTSELFDEPAFGLALGTKLRRRPPVVTIMGHVDHGKTTLLDALRQSEIVKQEHGGITQHIGAFVVSLDQEAQAKVKQVASNSARSSIVSHPLKKKYSFEERIKNIEKLVTFLDTPGHSAFSSMRQRGANATDIVVLVVAADDGVMDQTIESIRYAQNAGVPMIVAINKLDKIPRAELQQCLQRVKLGLNSQNIILEEDGGETLCVRISALKQEGIEDVKEAILALAETMEIRAPVDGRVEGVVIESTVDPQRGPLATVLVQRGTLKRGDSIVASDDCWAKVKSMYDEWGTLVKECPPGFPTQILGWRDGSLPEAGDVVKQVASESHAKQIIAQARKRSSEEKAKDAKKRHEEHMKEHNKIYREALIIRRQKGIRYGRYKDPDGRPKEYSEDPNDEFKISLILKCDVHGSLEAILQVLNSYPNDLRKDHALLDMVHSGIGRITEADVEMAACFPNPVIYAFNITDFIEPAAQMKANELGVTIRNFNVIYHLVRDVRETLESKLPLVDQEVVVGEAQVLQEFLVSQRKKRTAIAGCRCVNGSLKRKNVLYKLIRGDEVIAESLKCQSLKHVKEDVQLITKGMECGLALEDPPKSSITLRYQKGDRIVCYEMTKVKQRLKWSPKGF